MCILLIVLVIVLLLFGRGKIPQLMGDMAKGIKSFKRGMDDEEKKNVHVKLTGACAGCAASSFTLKLGVEETLKEYLPNDVESVSHEEGEVINPYY